MRGAEAVLTRKTVIGKDAVVKLRNPKGYRNPELDRKLRIERTRGEARLLNRAKLAGVDCPVVLGVGEFSITMTLVHGERPRMDAVQSREAGMMLGRLHGADIIHGDFTPANLIAGRSGMVVIDFGLGFVSDDIEDKAVDVFTMLRSIGAGSREPFIEGYRAYSGSGAVLGRVKDVEKRVRYAF
ncbi:MAG: KEOPS complex kinase/ATPase Bud32 [Candidatus Micrarchaeia archaeon]